MPKIIERLVALESQADSLMMQPDQRLAILLYEGVLGTGQNGASDVAVCEADIVMVIDRATASASLVELIRVLRSTPTGLAAGR